MVDITAPRFKTEKAARKHLEAVRWPEGPICPHCGSIDRTRRITGKSARPGLWFCADCRQQFTVTVGTVFERSKIPLHKWLLAVHLMSASKKGISAHQLHRMLGVTYKTAWFMAHRIREAMTEKNPGPIGGSGKTIEADETYQGPQGYTFSNESGWKVKMGKGDKRAIVALVERGGEVRTFHVDKVNAKTLRTILVINTNRASALMTDEFPAYHAAGQEFASHGRVCHSAKEYVRGDAHTNTVEGYFSIFKRGMKGVYQHCGEQHLQRYLNEFQFRYNWRHVEDAERRDEALKGIAGKRLTYRRTDQRAHI